jgi:hypothetical protein
MAKMAQKTFKLPSEWSLELNKIIGRRMAETGVETSFACFLKEVLDGHCKLSELTGVDADGQIISNGESGGSTKQ